MPGLTQAVIDQVSATAQSRYGYDTLGLSPNAVEEDEKIIGKASVAVRLTRRSNVDVQELAFFYQK